MKRAKMPPEVSPKLRRDVAGHLSRAADQVRQEMGRWALFEFSRKDGLPTLRFLVAPDGSAQATLCRRKNGTISNTLRGGKRHDDLLDVHEDLYWELVKLFETRTLAEALSSGTWAKSDLLQALADPETKKFLKGELEDTALGRVGDMCRNAVMPSGYRDSRIDEFPTLPRRLIKAHFLDKDTVATADLISSGSAWAYNFAVVNRRVLENLRREEKHTFRLFLTHVVPGKRGLPITAGRLSREDVEKMLVEALEISGEERQYLNSGARGHGYRQEGGENAHRKAGGFCRAMRGAGISPEAADRGSAFCQLAHSPLGGQDGAPREEMMRTLLLYDEHRGEAGAENALWHTLTRMEMEWRQSPRWEPRTWEECLEARYE